MKLETKDFVRMSAGVVTQVTQLESTWHTWFHKKTAPCVPPSFIGESNTVNSLQIPMDLSFFSLQVEEGDFSFRSRQAEAGVYEPRNCLKE